MRGYEASSLPADGDYTIDTLASDVAAWIDELNVGPVHLVGHDWGAGVAYAAARATPERFLSLTTFAVPHLGRFLSEIYRFPGQLRMSWYLMFFQLRGLSDRIVERNDYAFLHRLWRTWSPGWAFSEREFANVRSAFATPGVVQGALGYYRAALSPGSLPLSRAMRESLRWKINVPTLAITGADEGCIAADVFQALMYDEDFPAGLKVVEIPDAGHFVHREKPAIVNTLLLDWFNQHAVR